MKIRNHRLQADPGESVDYLRSPNQSGAITPRYLVMHFTAGRDLASSRDWFLNPAARASAHVLIGRDGAVLQMVAFNRKAWHAGVSHWEGLSGLNSHSIGIELDNRGKLEPREGGWGPWFDPGRVEPAEDVMEAAHRHGGACCGWQRYTGPQMDSALTVASLIVARYGLLDVIGHEDIAPGRKTDPGPAFPLASFRARVMGRAEVDDSTWLATTRLNIRGGPGIAHAPLDASPLPAGTRCRLLQTHDDWRFVEAQPAGDPLRGWVHGFYLRRAEIGD